MKFSIAALFLIASSVSAGSDVTANLMKSARRLDQAAAEDEYAFLSGYSLKLLSCKSGEAYVNPVTGLTESSSVVFRLCPTTGDCSDESNNGCSAGYGDYVIGLNTFVYEYLEDKRDEMQTDDNFKVEELGECRQYDGDKDGEGDGTYYYVGPACSDDGAGVKVGLFTDAYCSEASTDVTFEELSNGISLPYSTGGLVSKYCESCNGYNDKGELSPLCMDLHMYAGKCETKMETYSSSGQDTSACDAISALIPKSQKSGNGGKVVGWLFFILVVAGVGAFAFTAMKKKKDEKTFGLMT